MPDGVEAFSTLRCTDLPEQPYEGFNACHYTGDSPDHVSACRINLCKKLGIPGHNLIIPRQTHSANITIVDHTPFPAQSLDDIDALVTALPDVALCINTADCVPIVLADTQAGIIAAVHSGWRGTVARIAARTVETMCSLGADPSRIHAAMGPSICPACFEVGPEVAEIFNRSFPGTPTVISSGVSKPHVDLPAAISATLTECGLPPGNISTPAACSFHTPHQFFSARRLGIASGRTLTVIINRR